MHAGWVLWLVLVAPLLLLGGCAERASKVNPEKGAVGSEGPKSVRAEGSAESTGQPRNASSRPVSETATSAPEPTAKQGSGSVVKLAYFGEVTIDDGAMALMDGGTHGVQGHTVMLAADGAGTWARRIESLRPHGKPGSGRFQPSAEELTRIRASRAELWKLAAAGSGSFYPPIEDGPPRWVWAIVMRHGDETRVLEGGAITPGAGNTPPKARALLEWLIERVDALDAAP